MHSAVLAWKGNLFPAPELAHGFNAFKQRRLVRRRCVLGAQDEIIRLPARGKADASAPVSEVVDHRPFFGNAGRMMKRRDAGPSPHADVLCHRSDCRTRDRRVRIGAAKGMEVAFRRPDRIEPMLVLDEVILMLSGDDDASDDTAVIFTIVVVVDLFLNEEHIVRYPLLVQISHKGCHRLIVGGGVAANQSLRDALQQSAKENEFELTVAPMDLCTDNAVMGAIALEKIRRGDYASLDLDVTPGLQRGF